MGTERAGNERVELEVFATNGTIAVPPDADGVTGVAFDGPSLAEHLRHGYARVTNALDGHAAAGHRPGAVPVPITSTRRGNACEVVRPMLVDPGVASAMALSAAFRRRHHRYLSFSHDDTDDDGARSLTWDVVIAPPGHHRPVPATLHLLASPSMVVSVLELIPHRRFRWRRKAFLSAGVAAIDSLAREFEHAYAS